MSNDGGERKPDLNRSNNNRPQDPLRSSGGNTPVFTSQHQTMNQLHTPLIPMLMRSGGQFVLQPVPVSVLQGQHNPHMQYVSAPSASEHSSNSGTPPSLQKREAPPFLEAMDTNDENDESNDDMQELPPALDKVGDIEEYEEKKDSKPEMLLETMFLNEGRNFMEAVRGKKVIEHHFEGVTFYESNAPFESDPEDVPPTLDKKDVLLKQLAFKEKLEDELNAEAPSSRRRRKKNSELDQLLDMDFGPKAGSKILEELKPKRRSNTVNLNQSQDKEEFDSEGQSTSRSRPKRRSRAEKNFNEDSGDDMDVVPSTHNDDKCMQCGSDLKTSRSKKRPQYCKRGCRDNFLRTSVDNSEKGSSPDPSIRDNDLKEEAVIKEETPAPTVPQVPPVPKIPGRRGRKSEAQLLEINTPKSTTTQKVEPPKVEEQQQEEKVAVPTPPPVPEPVSEPISSSPAVVSASRTVSTDSPNEGGPVPQGDPRNWKTSDVSQWVQSVTNSSEIAAKFEAEDVDGFVLLTMTAKDFRDDPFKMKFGVACRMEGKLDELCRARDIANRLSDPPFEAYPPDEEVTVSHVYGMILKLVNNPTLAEAFRSEEIDGYALKSSWDEIIGAINVESKFAMRRRLDLLHRWHTAIWKNE